jgi:lipopolysaccharide biosynthesis glycosyltransferase
MRSIWIGYEPRQAEAYGVLRHSILERCIGLPVHAIELTDVRQRGLYTRKHRLQNNQMWDEISEAPMSTEFAISRFLTKELAGRGWALFMDCDILCRRHINWMFELYAKPEHAVVCVKHPNYTPPEVLKMDGQIQTLYARKNWSSVMLFNCDHPANRKLTVELINSVPGRDLHRFCWLDDHEIGEMPVSWNYLVGTSQHDDPHLVHFTAGGPWLPEYENVPYAQEWRDERARWLQPPQTHTEARFERAFSLVK